MSRTAFLASAFSIAMAGGAAANLDLDTLAQCSDPNEGGGAGFGTNGIQISDVVGNSGGADDCWGTNNGNDTQDAPFELNGVVYSLLSKSDDGTTTSEGIDIGLTWSGGSSGTWSFDETLVPGGQRDFLIGLKVASSPGYALWSFFGSPNNTSTSGTYNVAWTTGQGGANPALSHLSVYIAPVPIPAGLTFLALGLAGLGYAAHRQRVANSA